MYSEVIGPRLSDDLLPSGPTGTWPSSASRASRGPSSRPTPYTRPRPPTTPTAQTPPPSNRRRVSRTTAGPSPPRTCRTRRLTRCLTVSATTPRGPRPRTGRRPITGRPSPTGFSSPPCWARRRTLSQRTPVSDSRNIVCCTVVCNIVCLVL